MNIQEFVKETFKEEYGSCFRPRIICNDGFSMSVQGSNGHYCNPRKTQDWYNSLEIGFPSHEEPLINKYAETEYDWTGTVYGYVPIETIQEVIEKHGGININETLNF
jgi:hypothetical protein